jgi:hypothetical protein
LLSIYSYNIHNMTMTTKRYMTEEAKLGRLWSGFHRLSTSDRVLVLKFAEAMPRRGETDEREIAAKKSREQGPSGLEEKT